MTEPFEHGYSIGSNNLGLDLVRAHVEAAGETEQERWAAMERILSEPTLPADLLPIAKKL